MSGAHHKPAFAGALRPLAGPGSGSAPDARCVQLSQSPSCSARDTIETLSFVAAATCGGLAAGVAL